MRREKLYEEEVPLITDIQDEEEISPWNTFVKFPRKANVGSEAGAKWVETAVKFLKLFTIIFVFAVVLTSAVFSKATMLLMTSQIKKNTTRAYCNQDLDTRQQYVVNITPTERATWIWYLIFAYWVPELGTFIRSVRISLFKSWKKPTAFEFISLFFTESLPAIGSAILIFIVLPELDVVKGAMLTNAVCFVPAIIYYLRNHYTLRSSLSVIIDIICIIAQASSFVVWPLIEGRPVLFFIPIAVILISVGWWENFVSEESPIPIVNYLGRLHASFNTNRYYMYSFVSIWKCILFAGTTLLILVIRDGDAMFMFDNFEGIFRDRRLNISEIEPIIGGSSVNFDDARATGTNSYLTTSFWTPLAVWIINIGATYICYAFGKFACKVMIQGFGLAFPINFTVPVLLSMLIGMCGAFNKDECAFRDLMPQYLFFTTPPLYFLNDFVGQQHSWIWLVWLLSQAWITSHIWDSNASSDKLCSTEQLFVRPMYDAFLIDQSIAMNRRRKLFKDDLNRDATYLDDDETRIYACGTMWHESREEMMEFLKSIMRLDEDQCAHRMMRKHHKKKRSDYYEFETHIFFDDAFFRYEGDPEPHVNSYVQLLVEQVDKAACEVHQDNDIRVLPPVIYPTPYGGQLVWTLPGQTKMIAHLKDKAKIRAKKRWSQVMYMYYLLGHKLMADNSLQKEQTDKISANTYILALDGDIDFQPDAVKLLVDYMKRNRGLGAACGRIHPIGSGFMAWYQMFEYAVGHWLQKATEHVIGCVLCSPGCFSLFRGSALMDENVMAKYTTVSEEPLHYVQYDQGEDRWLCTLLLQRGWKVEYAAASDAFTHCPEGFNEFYNQRRRWMPSTTANILDLLGESKQTVKVNDNISSLYIFYQIILMIGTIIGPGSIFLMLVGAFVAAFKLNQWASFWWNVTPILVFVIVCATTKEPTQLFFAGLISAIYGLIMMAVFVGVMLQISDDGFLAPSSLFFFVMAGEFIIAASLHPKEFNCLKYGVIYYVTVPSMYLLLVIYSVFNMNNVSWGTREVTIIPKKKEDEDKKKEEDAKKPAEKKKDEKTMDKVLSFFGGDAKDNAGSLEFSCASLFKCMWCTHKKDGTEQELLRQIQTDLLQLSRKLDQIERIQLTGAPDVFNFEPRKTIARPTLLEGARASRNSRKSVRLSKQSEEQELIEEEDEDDVSSLGQSDVKVMTDVEWMYDEVFENRKVTIKDLNMKEEKFWKDMMKHYLLPIDDTDKKDVIAKDLKDLRDKVVISFLMLNALYVLVVFLLTLEKDTIHLNWPIDIKYNFTYVQDINQVQLYRNYLQLEPIGFVFLIFFALLLVVQFMAMLVHRFGTFSHVMATTKLDYFTGSQKKLSDNELLERDPIKIYRKIMEDKEKEKEKLLKPAKRKTIMQMWDKRKAKKQVRFLNLVQEFEKKYDAVDIATGNDANIRKKTLRFLKQDFPSDKYNRSTSTYVNPSFQND